MIVTGGGISPDGSRWISSRPDYLVPVEVLSALFRRRMLEMLLEAHDGGQLQFFGQHEHLADRRAFKAYLKPLRKIDWFVYAKRPFAGPELVLAYLARYTHRVAISNSRLISADANGVTFKYKDYRIEGPERYKTRRSRRASLSAASSCTSCPRASTASDTTACSPMAPSPGPRPSNALAN
jgi:hypothetical protein